MTTILCFFCQERHNKHDKKVTEFLIRIPNPRRIWENTFFFSFFLPCYQVLSSVLPKPNKTKKLVFFLDSILPAGKKKKRKKKLNLY